MSEKNLIWQIGLFLLNSDNTMECIECKNMLKCAKMAAMSYSAAVAINHLMTKHRRSKYGAAYKNLKMKLRRREADATKNVDSEEEGNEEEEGNLDEGENIVVDGNSQNDTTKEYVDHLGQHWRFIGEAGSEEGLLRICQENWLSKGKVNKNVVSYCCRKIGNGCKFRGIYEKNIVTMFARNEHNHPMEDVENLRRILEKGNYRDQFGREWCFIAKFDNAHAQKRFRHRNFLQIYASTKHKSYYQCKYATAYYRKRHSSVAPCKVRAIFDLVNNCLYSNNEKHNHSMPRDENKEEADEQDEEGEEEEMEENRREGMEEKSGILDVPAAEEEKKAKAKKSNNNKEDYVDRFGKIWRFQQKARDEQELDQICHQNWLRKYRSLIKTIEFYCKRKQSTQCKYRAIYQKQTGSFFTQDEHNHPLWEASKPGVSDDGKIYVDRSGKIWRFLAIAHTEGELRQKCGEHWIKRSRSYKLTDEFTCRQIAAGCKFRGIYAKKNVTLFVHGEHNHPTDLQKIRRNKIGLGEKDAQNYYVDATGQAWRFMKKVQSREQLRHVCRRICLIFSNDYKSTIQFRCSKKSWHYCKFRGIYKKETASLFVLGEHNHPLKSRKYEEEMEKEEEEDAEEEQENEDDNEEKEEDDVDTEMEDEEEDGEMVEEDEDKEDEDGMEDKEGEEEEDEELEEEEEKEDEEGREMYAEYEEEMDDEGNEEEDDEAINSVQFLDFVDHPKCEGVKMRRQGEPKKESDTEAVTFTLNEEVGLKKKLPKREVKEEEAPAAADGEPGPSNRGQQVGQSSQTNIGTAAAVPTATINRQDQQEPMMIARERWWAQPTANHGAAAPNKENQRRLLRERKSRINYGE